MQPTPNETKILELANEITDILNSSRYLHYIILAEQKCTCCNPSLTKFFILDKDNGWVKRAENSRAQHHEHREAEVDDLAFAIREFQEVNYGERDTAPKKSSTEEEALIRSLQKGKTFLLEYNKLPSLIKISA
ncbi:MAG: hypothetical protein COV29_02940 [Candidatus Yanofskybacteria bacterium CG10_big_fil_rev_8_21_14_0_10_36_16]|uniref:Uncharacterized protein n=1 Tax=Candidatus Yanofskybacteria bacterium CG10_big_fil_rev_8_21_14_0_10_36_16 TaxID=1975096 RepID=A0A2J0QAG0_9BACT|nr:MAG: hypothetical protein COV29_02940 [Candidatus Yanofskybacteria bacterium CG10_big_fil_rev_8_21_14_0_10_36_16]